MPLVSVVLIFLNEERFLPEAIASVLAQKLTDWELILVDDGSTDRSTDIARAMASQDERITYCDHPGHQNRGMSASRNLGAAHGSAPFIAFLDADDVWMPDKLTEQVNLLRAMPDVGMVVGAPMYWYSWDPASTTSDKVLAPGGFSDVRFEPREAAIELYPLKRRPGGVIGGLIRRSAFDEVGGYEERFRAMYEDQALYLKLYLRYPVYISSSTWLRYRQLAISCCGSLSRADRLRRRAEFLEWLEDSEAVVSLHDKRINSAIRRRRAELPILIMLAPVADAIDRVRNRSALA